MLIWWQCIAVLSAAETELSCSVATGFGRGSQYGCAERTVPGTAIACQMSLG